MADPNIPPSHIQLDPTGKRIVSPFGIPPVMNGYDANALEEALRLREKLAAIAGAHLGCAPAEVVFAGGQIHVLGHPDRGVPFMRLAANPHWAPGLLPPGVEPGLREYVESLDFVQHKIFEDCPHPEAMNVILELAQGEQRLPAAAADRVGEDLDPRRHTSHSLQWMHQKSSSTPATERNGRRNFAS